MGQITCMLGILENISHSELVSNGYISNHNKVRRPRPNSESLFIYISPVSESMLLKQTLKTYIKEKYKESFLIVVSSWNRDFNFDARAPSIPLLNFPFNRGPHRAFYTRVKFAVLFQHVVFLF